MLNSYHCTHCHKLLFKGLLVEGRIEVKCRGCHELVIFEPTPLASIICKKVDCPNRMVDL